MTNETPLQSWKEIGAYLQRDSTTARRWEKEEGLPVHRHTHKSRSSVYAFPSEIDAWRASRKAVPEPPPPLPLWKTLLAPPRSLAFGVTVLACLVMVGNGTRPASAQQSARPLTTRLVMTHADPGFDVDSIAPDGRLGVGTDWSNGDLVVTDLATGQLTRLIRGTLEGRTLGPGTAEGRYVAWPVISPDQREVAFDWYGDPEKPSQGQLWVVANEPNAKPRLVTKNPEYRNLPVQNWSPNGKSVLANIELVDDGGYQIAWIEIGDGSAKVLKSFPWDQHPDYWLRLSPDGKYIAYAAPSTRNSREKYIHILAADGSSESVLTNTAGINESPAWTPDGSHILFVSDRSGAYDLWSIPVRDGKAAGVPSPVKRDIGRITNVGMTRSGSYLYTAKSNVEVVSIHEIGANGAKSTAENVVGVSPTWSPDGSLLAFGRRRAGRPGVFDLVIRSVSSGGETIYDIKGGILPAPAAWFHDGKGLLVLGPGPGPGNANALYRVDLKTKQFQALLELDPPSEYASGLFAISPDEKSIYVAGRDSKDNGRTDRILAFDAATKIQRVVFRLPSTGTMTAFALSPDGKMFALKRDDAKDSHVATVATNGAGYRELYSDAKGSFPNSFGLTWTKDSQSILFGGRLTSGSWQIRRLSSGGGKPEPLGPEVSGSIRTVDLNGDGTRAVLGAMKQVQELWSLDNVPSVVQ